VPCSGDGTGLGCEEFSAGTSGDGYKHLGVDGTDRCNFCPPSPYVQVYSSVFDAPPLPFSAILQRVCAIPDSSLSLIGRDHLADSVCATGPPTVGWGEEGRPRPTKLEKLNVKARKIIRQKFQFHLGLDFASTWHSWRGMVFQTTTNFLSFLVSK